MKNMVTELFGFEFMGRPIVGLNFNFFLDKNVVFVAKNGENFIFQTIFQDKYNW